MSTYSIRGYGEMIADRTRMEAYVHALREAVRPGSAVVDIGTGTGIFAVLACRFGARRVYAIEPDDAIQIARETAAANGCADRIEFMQALSTKVELPERADVILSDLRGVLPLFERHISSIVDARERMLAPSGVLIPRQDSLWVAVASAPEAYGRHVQPWGAETYGVDMRASRRKVANSWTKRRIKPDQVLLPAKQWATLDYRTITQADVNGEVAWTTEQPGIAHGLVVWFDAELGENIGFSNSPESPELIYGSAFFPWPQPVSVDAGDTVSVDLRADLIGDDYLWRWDTRVASHGQPGPNKADFRQSSLQGVPLSPQRLRAQSSRHVPRLGEDGRIDMHALSQMDGDLSLETIAKDVVARYPHRFRDWRDALTRVGELSQKYGDED